MHRLDAPDVPELSSLVFGLGVNASVLSAHHLDCLGRLDHWREERRSRCLRSPRAAHGLPVFALLWCCDLSSSVSATEKACSVVGFNGHWPFLSRQKKKKNGKKDEGEVKERVKEEIKRKRSRT